MHKLSLFVSLAVLVGLASSIAISPAPAPYFGIGGPFYPGALGGLGLGLGLGGIGGIGGIGLGLGGLGLGGLGLGGLGLLGPFGPLGGLGMGLGTFGPLGNARLGGIRGRRSLDSLLHGSKKDHGEIECELTRTVLSCKGPHEIVQCEVESHVSLPIKLGNFKVSDFTLREKVMDNVETLKVLPKNVGHRMGSKLEHLFIYEDAKFTEPGFLVKDSSCFSDVLTLVKELPDKIKLKLKDDIAETD